MLCDDTEADINVAVFDISRGKISIRKKMPKIHHAVILHSLVELIVRFTFCWLLSP